MGARGMVRWQRRRPRANDGDQRQDDCEGQRLEGRNPVEDSGPAPPAAGRPELRPPTPGELGKREFEALACTRFDPVTRRPSPKSRTTERRSSPATNRAGSLREEMAKPRPVILRRRQQPALDVAGQLQLLDRELLLQQAFEAHFRGPNGAGKTTMNCLTGLLRPDASEVAVFGRDVAAAETSWKEDVGYVGESSGLPPCANGRGGCLQATAVARRSTLIS